MVTLQKAKGVFYPPTQKRPYVNPGMNAKKCLLLRRDVARVASALDGPRRSPKGEGGFQGTTGVSSVGLHRIACFLVLTSFLGGCIRFYGEAGYTRGTVEPGQYETKTLSVDTQRLLGPDGTAGRIETGEN